MKAIRRAIDLLKGGRSSEEWDAAREAEAEANTLRDVVLTEVCQQVAKWADSAAQDGDDDAAEHLNIAHNCIWAMKTKKEPNS